MWTGKEETVPCGGSNREDTREHEETRLVGTLQGLGDAIVVPLEDRSTYLIGVGEDSVGIVGGNGLTLSVPWTS